MGTAFLCAGQGSQVVGMGADLVAACAECRATFEAADAALGFPLSRVMADGPAEELRRTAIAQPAILTLSVAHAVHLQSLGIMPEMLMGHSLGQYSALVVAGALDFASAVRLVSERGRLMQDAVPEGVGAMMAIIGLERDLVYAACQAVQAIGVVNVASHNAPGQTVISGGCDAVSAAAERCEEQGGSAVPLTVSAPFHCQLLAPMMPAFTSLVEATAFKDPALPVVDNVTARPLTDAAAVRRSLIAQIMAPVLFEEGLRFLGDARIDRFVQCGPGKSLLGFAKRTVQGVELVTFEQAASLWGAVPSEVQSENRTAF
jgi:[acyl-carrier-protein] S-malonyltransferase